ncbi:imm11 family protein [Pseudaestuariivita rosea]|uniref:imm11 family protein n=1 Tax=Pseudaestuariivita rosea TaxID=2763263 RepID=UPI0030133A1F
MAWGMHEPSSFGAFFPEVSYVGWYEELRRQYFEELTDAEKAKLGMTRSFDLTNFTNRFRNEHGEVRQEWCPKEFRTAKGYKTLGSLIMLNGGLLAVDEGLKLLIEELEPGVHQFWPIKISMPRNKVYPGNYYGLRIGQFLDTFNPDHSKDGCYRIEGYENYRGIAPIKKAITGLAVSHDAIGGAHLWREQKLSQPDIFLSDTLEASAAKQGLRLPKHYQMKEV